MPVAQSAVVATARETAPVATTTASPVAQPTTFAQPTEALIAASPAQARKLSVGQRLLLHRVLKQAARATARQQNTAGVTHTAAVKGPLTVGLVGLVALLIGIIASSGFLITVGIIVLVIAIVLFVLKA